MIKDILRLKYGAALSHGAVARTLARLSRKFFGEVPAVELLQQRAGFHQPKDVGQRRLGVDGDALEQKLVGAAGDVDLLQSTARVVGLRPKGSHDQLGAWAQDQVLHRDGTLAARTGLGPAARPGPSRGAPSARHLLVVINAGFAGPIALPEAWPPLVVEMQYRAGIVWVKFVGTHEQFDRINVASVNADQAHSHR
ncbi:MAG: type II toxin-antitoxin system HigB family toxin [Rubrivivax sp.]|nr:type II toxin-antitoxin system HigB family toxin [Rubrivivax sp.]